MCLAETYSRVWVGKNLSDMFPIRNGLKQGDAVSPLLFDFALEYAIRCRSFWFMLMMLICWEEACIV